MPFVCMGLFVMGLFLLPLLALIFLYALVLQILRLKNSINQQFFNTNIFRLISRPKTTTFIFFSVIKPELKAIKVYILDTQALMKNTRHEKRYIKFVGLGPFLLLYFVFSPVLISNSHPVAGNRTQCSESHHLNRKHGNNRVREKGWRPVLNHIRHFPAINSCNKSSYKSTGY